MARVKESESKVLVAPRRPPLLPAHARKEGLIEGPLYNLGHPLRARIRGSNLDYRAPKPAPSSDMYKSVRSSAIQTPKSSSSNFILFKRIQTPTPAIHSVVSLRGEVTVSRGYGGTGIIYSVAKIQLYFVPFEVYTGSASPSSRAADIRILRRCCRVSYYKRGASREMNVE